MEGDFVSERTLLSDDVSMTRKLRPSRLFDFIQEISIAHTIALGYPRETTLDKGYLWVIGRESLSIKRMPEYDERIRVSTYPDRTLKVLYPRSYEIQDEKGETLIEGMAVWTLIDEKTRTVVEPEISGVIIKDASHGRCLPFPRALRLENLPHKKKLVASYSQCDLNGHMNNTKYLDIAEDLIPMDFLLSHDLIGISVVYKKEIKCGEEFEVEYGPYGKGFAFHGDRFDILLEFGEGKDVLLHQKRL